MFLYYHTVLGREALERERMNGRKGMRYIFHTFVICQLRYIAMALTSLYLSGACVLYTLWLDY